MDSLLRWSIENSSPRNEADAPSAPAQPLDPGIIDMILGKPDAVVMKEMMAIAGDDSRSEADRVAALDHFEMLIEQIDNANNIEKLHLWEPLQDLLRAPGSPEQVKVHVLWVVGTAVQNNPAAQAVYLTYAPLPTLLAFLDPSPESSMQLRSKAIYALSGLLRHNRPAVEAVGDGWEKLGTALEDPNIGVRRKTAFLLGSLLIREGPPASGDTAPSASAGEQEPMRLTYRPASELDAGGRRGNATSVVEHASARQDPVIHANSHAGHLRDPGVTDTAAATLAGFAKYGVLDTAVDALVHPVPFGEDGDGDGDEEFSERLVQLLCAYGAVCASGFTTRQREEMRGWVAGAGAGGALGAALWNAVK